MKAAVIRNYGGPEMIELAEVPVPVPEENQVLIKVFAVSINDWDWGWMQGKTFFDRMLSGLSRPRKQILGSDIAGIITEIGKTVTRFKVGDAVYGDLSGNWGGFAEYVCARENQIELKPSSMSFEDAAAIPQAGMLAVQALIDKGKIRQGEKILINGAGGGVGTIAVQIAKLFEADITMVDSSSKLEMMRSLGAKQVVDYTKNDFIQLHNRYDLIIDTKTNRSVFKYLKVLAPAGRYITVGGSIPRIFQLFLTSRLIRIFTGKKAKLVVLKPNKDLQYFNKEYEAGRVKPLIGHVFKLKEIRDAFRLYDKAEHKGKIVIQVSGEV